MSLGECAVQGFCFLYQGHSFHHLFLFMLRKASEIVFSPGSNLNYHLSCQHQYFERQRGFSGGKPENHDILYLMKNSLITC